MYIYDLNFEYARNNKTIKSISVDLGDLDDSVKIPPTLIKAAQEYWEITEECTDLIFILARAICIREENFHAVSDCVRKYKLGNLTEFSAEFTKKLYELTQLVSIELIASFFSDAKLEDLDMMLNEFSANEYANILTDDSSTYDSHIEEY